MACCPICGKRNVWFSSLAGSPNQHRCPHRVLDEIDEDREEDLDTRQFGPTYADRLKDGMALIGLTGDGHTRRARRAAP